MRKAELRASLTFNSLAQMLPRRPWNSMVRRLTAELLDSIFPALAEVVVIEVVAAASAVVAASVATEVASAVAVVAALATEVASVVATEVASAVVVASEVPQTQQGLPTEASLFLHRDKA